jgi:hypothetical protein
VVPLPGDNCAQRGHLARSINVFIAGVALQQKLMQPETLPVRMMNNTALPADRARAIVWRAFRNRRDCL